jgi:ABC-type histidine transport system ATPase subunit
MGEAEGNLGLLYVEVVPIKTVRNPSTIMSLAQKKKLMTNVQLGQRCNPSRNLNLDDDDDDDEPTTTIGANLVDDVMGMLQQMDNEDEEFLQEKEESEREKELQKTKIGFLKYDGDLEKKSPANHLWQVRL